MTTAQECDFCEENEWRRVFLSCGHHFRLVTFKIKYLKQKNLNYEQFFRSFTHGSERQKCLRFIKVF